MSARPKTLRRKGEWNIGREGRDRDRRVVFFSWWWWWW